MIEIESFVLGPVETNAYLIANQETREAAVVDPAWDGPFIVEAAEMKGWIITQIWLTHAHFDHIGGVADLLKFANPKPSLALHPDDLPLYRLQGGAMFFGLHLEQGPDPTQVLEHKQQLRLGEDVFEVRHTPGHTPGHVIFSCPAEKIAFCGDVIFQGSIGRTDLPGGSFPQLLRSIETQILSLPDETRLFSGHGPVTTVGKERLTNPFLR
jgi:glyoxylase-like metal-dependent hydrolase (beta-lactamase superfamily II)